MDSLEKSSIGQPHAAYFVKESKAMARKRTSLESLVDEQDQHGPETAGQAGDTQGLSNLAEADSESVAELVEEGQYFEAAVVNGIENAPDADVAEVKTRQVPEDDVPIEYQKHEQD
jgi:hypothetical protein